MGVNREFPHSPAAFASIPNARRPGVPPAGTLCFGGSCFTPTYTQPPDFRSQPRQRFVNQRRDVDSYAARPTVHTPRLERSKVQADTNHH